MREGMGLPGFRFLTALTKYGGFDRDGIYSFVTSTMCLLFFEIK